MWKEIDPIAVMQAQIATLYRKQHNLSIKEFLDLDSKVDLLGYIALCYEPFHLTGEEGILDDVNKYCCVRLARDFDCNV